MLIFDLQLPHYSFITLEYATPFDLNTLPAGSRIGFIQWIWLGKGEDINIAAFYNGSGFIFVWSAVETGELHDCDCVPSAADGIVGGGLRLRDAHVRAIDIDSIGVDGKVVEPDGAIGAGTIVGVGLIAAAEYK